MRTILQLFARLIQIFRSAWRGFFSLAKSRFSRLTATQRYGAAIFVLVILALLFTGGVQYYISHTGIVPAYGGTYREGVVGSSPRLINPVLASDSDADKTIARIIYPSLLFYDTGAHLVPSIADSYTVDPAGKHYHFVLKNNLVWDDGQPLTAADVVFTVNLIQDASYNSPLRANWLGVKATQDGDNAVSFDLSTPYPPFLQNTTLGILPKHVWENIPASSFSLAEANTKPVGAGPYKFDALQKDTNGSILSYNLTRNDRYWGSRAYLDAVDFTFYPNEGEALRAYQNKTIDGLGLVSATDLSQIADPSQATIHRFTIPRYFAVFFNQSQQQALQDPAVRQALASATDKQALVQDVLGGYGEPVQGPILPFMDAYNARAKIYPFDIKQADQILDSANWIAPTGGDGVRQKMQGKQTTRLEFTLATADAPELVQTAQELQKQWQQIGVKINIQTYSLSDLQQSVIATRQYQMLLFGQFLSLDPDPFPFWHSSQTSAPGLNLALYNNKDVDKLLESARAELDPAKRAQDLQSFQADVANDVPAVFLYNPSFVYLTQKTIKGLDGTLLADPVWRLAHIGNWYVETQRTWK